MTQKATSTQTKSTHGFSLVEVIYTMGIFSFLSIGVMMFYTNSQVAMFKTAMRINNSSDLRKLMQELDNDARSADAIILHDSFSGNFREPDENTDASDYRLTNGQSGNLIMLVYYGVDDDPSDNQIAPLDKIIVYTIDSDDVSNEYAPIYRIELPVASTNAYGLPEALIPDDSSSASKVTELARGLTNSDLFYQFRDNCISMCSSIQNGNDHLSVNNIYNFTITTR